MWEIWELVTIAVIAGRRHRYWGRHCHRQVDWCQGRGTAAETRGVRALRPSDLVHTRSRIADTFMEERRDLFGWLT